VPGGSRALRGCAECPQTAVLAGLQSTRLWRPPLGVHLARGPSAPRDALYTVLAGFEPFPQSVRNPVANPPTPLRSTLSWPLDQDVADARFAGLTVELEGY
jgi:hypothetical protein